MWLWSDDLLDCFEVFTVHVEERGCLPVFWVWFWGFLIHFQLVFLCFFFFTRKLQGVGKEEAVVKHFI